MTLRIALIDDQTGECEIGGVRCKVVPKDATWAMQYAGTKHDTEDEHADIGADVSGIYKAMLSAAAIDLSGLPVVPDMPDLRYHGEYRRGFANALDAMGVPK